MRETYNMLLREVEQREKVVARREEVLDIGSGPRFGDQVPRTLEL